MLAPLHVLHAARRQVLIRRRTLAALCAALAVWSAIDALTVAPPAEVALVTAAHDLDSGTVLAASDLRRTRFSPGSVPADAARDPGRLVGRTLLTPMARGEPLSRRHLLGTGALVGYPGLCAIGLRIPDEDVVGLLDPGDRVDLVASDPQGDHDPERLVRDAVVLALPEPDPDAARTGVASAGRLVLFAVPREDAEHIAAVANSLFLTVIWNR